MNTQERRGGGGTFPGRRPGWQQTQQTRFGEDPERFYSLAHLEKLCREEHTDWSDDEVRVHAEAVMKVREDETRRWYNQQRRFHRNNALGGLLGSAVTALRTNR